MVWVVGVGLPSCGVGSKCFLIPGLLVWTLVWVGGVGPLWGFRWAAVGVGVAVG